MSLLFNRLSGLVTAFLPRSKCLLISWLQSTSAVIWGLKKIKPVITSIFPHLFAMKWCVVLSTSWNQDCWEKYQLPQICRWHHPYGRKWRTKEPLEEGERREWKSWLKAQHSENEDHGIWSHHFMENRWGNCGNSVRLYFFEAPKSLQMEIAAMKLKDTYSLEEKLWPN